MRFNMREYENMLKDNDIHVIYSGPIWANGIDGLSELVLKRLEYGDMPFPTSQAIFSIFVEQINNIMMYSAEKERKNDAEGNIFDVSTGIFILGLRDTEYFIQTGNAVTPNSAAILKSRIDHLNTLDKQELRQLYRKQLKAENINPESKGAGIGLIEVARRASDPIKYELEPYEGGLQYFTMYLTVRQGGKE